MPGAGQPLLLLSSETLMGQQKQTPLLAAAGALAACPPIASL